MVMETSARVCMCQLLSPRELKIPSTDSELEKMPAVVSLCFLAASTIFFTPSARSWGVSEAVSAKWREGNCMAKTLSSALPAASRGIRHGQQIRVRVLHFCQILR